MPLNFLNPRCLPVLTILVLAFLSLSQLASASPIRPPPILQRRSPTAIRNLFRRQLLITMLDGGPVDPLFVDLLDQWTIIENGVKNTPEGTPRHSELIQLMEEKASELMELIDGVAIIQSIVPPSSTSTDPPASEATPAETTPGATVSEAPVVTVIPQGNTDIVVLASEGTTTTRTLAEGRPTLAPAPTGAAGDEADGTIPRSPASGTRAGQGSGTGFAQGAQASEVLSGSGGRPLPWSSFVVAMCTFGVWFGAAF